MEKNQWSPLQQIYLLAGKEKNGQLPTNACGGPELSKPLERLVLLPVNSRRIHACWTISSDTDFEEEPREGEGKLPKSPREDFTLRLYRHRKEDKENKEVFFLETPMSAKTGKSYLAVEPDIEYFAELGIFNGDGQFHSRLRSNKIRTPREAPLADPLFSDTLREELKEGEKWKEEAGKEISSPLEQIFGNNPIPCKGEKGGEIEIFRRLAEIYKGQIDFTSFNSIMASSSSGSFIEKYLELSQRLKGGADLTALCEKKFRSGISSPSSLG